MSTFITSKGTRAQHVSPKYQTQPYRQHPSRREFVHGKIVPMHQPRRCGLNSMCNAGIVLMFGVVVVLSAVWGWAW